MCIRDRVWDTASFENEAVPVRIDLEKLFETDYQSGKYVPGSGAVFGVFTAEEMRGSGKAGEKFDAQNIPADTMVGLMSVEGGQASITAVSYTHLVFFEDIILFYHKNPRN